ncbi:MAG: DUF5719 family protein [Microbacteriaceae bacterium]
MPDDSANDSELSLQRSSPEPEPEVKKAKAATPSKAPKRSKAATADTESTPQVPPRNRRGAAIIGLRVAAGTIGAGVAAIALLAAGLAPIPSVQLTAEGTLVTPVPAARELVCPGSLLRLGDEFGQGATTPQAIGQPTVYYATTGDSVEVSALTDSDAGTGGTASAPSRLSVAPQAGAEAEAEAAASSDDESDVRGRELALISGAQSEAPSAAEFTGLAAASCRGAASETWLVGGSTDVGRTSLVTLSNPSDVVSSVAITIFSENGEIAAAGATGIVVQPRGQRVVSLAGFAPAIESPVIRVTSRGGQIVANVQQVTVRGLDAGGVDIIGASAGPSHVHVIPGVVVSRSLAVSESLGAQGFEDLAPVIRLLVPGDSESRVTVTIAPDDLPPLDAADDVESGGTSFSVDLAPGRVTDIPVEELADGQYTVTVTSQEPIIAGARVSTVSDSVSVGAVSGSASRRPASSDFAWFSAAPLLETASIVTIAEGASPRLHLHNAGSDDVTVVVATLGGGERPVSVLAGGSASIDVSAGSTLVVSGFELLYASVSFVGDAQIAAYTVSPPAAESTPITVYVQ